MPTALALSVALHGAGLIMAHELTQRRRIALTRAEAPPEAAPEERPEPEPEDEAEINPGIERGAAATLNWIGYEEYREHLARLAPVEQAAFTSSESRGDPDAPDPERIASAPASTPPQSESTPPTDEDVAQAEPRNEDVSNTAEADPGEAGAEDAVDDRIELATESLEPIAEQESAEPPIENAPIEDAPVEIPPDLETEPIDPEMAPEAANVQPDAPSESVPVEDAAEPPVIDSASAPETNEQASEDTEAPVGPEIESAEHDPIDPAGEPTEPDAAPSEKDAEATSVIRVDPARWNSGQPLALEGLEVRPYNLFRHIVVDSQDRLFAREFSGAVSQNPIVTIRFNRVGKAGEVVIIRPSGYEDFDRRYLKSWMARWSARGPELTTLVKDELTPAMRFKLIFIDEPEEAEEIESDDASESEDEDGSGG